MLPNCEVLEKILSTASNASVKIIAPDQGAKHRLLRLAEINARQTFGVKFFSEARFEAIAAELATMLNLKQVPRRIECVDISNLQGSDIVGALVCFQDGIPERKGYRKYKISFQDKPNDFEAIHEVVTRRLSKSEGLPDLLIIDGGRQQLERALQARDALNIKVEIISLAKIKVIKGKSELEAVHKPERIFVEGKEESCPLDEASPVTQFLQRIRDEVHRYVITYHRATRGKRVFRSILDDIPGIGAERRGRLLRAFGSIEKMKEESEESLATAGRMPLQLAQKLKKILLAS